MNAPTPNLPAERKPQFVAGAPVAALVPQTLEEAFRLSSALAASGMAPKGIDRPEQIMVAIMAGAELGLAPFQSLQSFAIVNGRPALYGDGLMAVARQHGVRVKEWIEGAGDAAVAHCEVTRPDGEIIARTFTVAQARKAGLWGKSGPWTQYPERMLGMRARAWALRDGCADMLRGIQVREEVEDYTHTARVVREPTGLRERLAGPAPEEGFNASQAADAPVEFAEHAEEIAEADFTEADAEAEAIDEPSPDGGATWDHAAWAAAMAEACDAITTADDVQAWWNEVQPSPEYQQLIAADEAEALALKARVVRHKRSLAAVAQ